MTSEHIDAICHGQWSDRQAPMEQCHLCQRLQPLLWHCAEPSILDRAMCRRTQGPGIWVCSLCEHAIHQWMRQHPSATAGRDAVDALFSRLSERLLAPVRKYTRRKETTDDT